ncbi:aspartyl-phosphate phosphatase Spo0E family protein [Aneurinibacillus sp. Ricciae_BoGa-3]|uniref:aspartyl-phosphate phosphatase Spo0E family protein n=1 Tax=Aneurinibacillus sp. Ricciae_BoGa-3 TaxID=3022697 RepID=UPI002340ABD0|nr:aspartyl-phosphate phosphatase Spo0E family protein [Aneurinibacillus sp. Ricciae_BoGa-3]WCK52844.1 aspartyl-phosphate phosphatase Spo0E family protein [Aneurinibacillus sp. Ricciae_BoGa-3]
MKGNERAEVEDRMEHMRQRLHLLVNNNTFSLDEPEILSLSTTLDSIILEFMNFDKK